MLFDILTDARLRYRNITETFENERWHDYN